MIGTITLNPSIDYHITVRGLVKDDANRAESVLETPGGKGINVSKVVRELGGLTHAYALGGGLPGALLKELTASLKFPLTLAAIKGDTRLNTILTDLKDHSQTRVSAPGPLMHTGDVRRLERLLLRVRPRPSFWVLGGSLSAGLATDTYAGLIAALQKDDVPCVLDTDNQALQKGLEAKPFMIKPNEYEMQRLTGKNLSQVDDYCQAAAFLVKRGIRLVVVSLGARGALFITAKESFHVLAPHVKVTSKVGAGDSLIGAVVLALSRGKNLREAARLGIAASTSAVMREAPRLCLRSDIPKLLYRVRVKTLKGC